MTYKLNGVEMSLQPTSGRWMPRLVLDTSGDGHPIYPAPREYEMRWQLSDPASVDQLIDYFNSVEITGTLVASLPQWNSSTYVFYDYTGCTMTEPEMNAYFSEYHTEVSLYIRNIRV